MRRRRRPGTARWRSARPRSRLAAGRSTAPKSHRGQLGHREAASTADHEVGPRIARRHVVDERDALAFDLVARIGFAQRGDVLLSRLVDDQRPFRQRQLRERRGHEIVETRGAQAAADDQQAHRPAAAGKALAPAEAMCTRNRAADCRPTRRASRERPLQRLRKAQQDPVRAIREHARGQSRHGIRVVQHQRLASRDAHESARKRRESAEAERRRRASCGR